MVSALASDSCSGNSTSTMPWVSNVGACNWLSSEVGPLLASTACAVSVIHPSRSPVRMARGIRVLTRAPVVSRDRYSSDPYAVLKVLSGYSEEFSEFHEISGTIASMRGSVAAAVSWIPPP